MLHVARDDARMARLGAALRFFHPDIECLLLPAWDCLPYDRVSPNSAIVAQRMEVLTRLAAALTDGESAAPQNPPAGRIVITTVNALLQRVPARDSVIGVRVVIATGGSIDLGSLVTHLDHSGYSRSGTVMEQGEYAPRGGIFDLFPPGAPAPVRIDLFGDRVESLREFDPFTQRSGDKIDHLVLHPVSEIRLDSESIARFRAGYRELFGAMTADDPLYESISAGRRHAGMEHWLALFHDQLDRIPDYV
ncbi:MAG: transcription-repair coupling factor, partial [Proteobacteria bacterium]|nr:transcription-repair coupling factor [Pseudomonadota bacterium]